MDEENKELSSEELEAMANDLAEKSASKQSSLIHRIWEEAYSEGFLKGYKLWRNSK